MAEYIDRGLFLKNVKHNAPFIYSMVAPIALITPSADVAPVRIGRWIHRNGYVECSECGTVGSPQWKCCPVCTARMDWEGSKNVKVD